MLLIKAKYCFPMQTSKDAFVKFDGSKVEFVDKENATDFVNEKGVSGFFVFALQNREAVRVPNSMFMEFWVRGYKGNTSWYGDKLELHGYEYTR